MRAVYARHRHDHTLTRRTLTQKTETELGGADLSTSRRVIKTIIAQIKLEEAEAETTRGFHADDKPTAPSFDYGARDFGPCAVSGVRVEEPVAAAAAPAEAAPVEAAAEPALPLALATADNSPLRAIDVVFHDDDDDRHPEENIEGRDGRRWDYAVADDDGEFDIKLDIEEAVRQGSFVTPGYNGGGASVATTAADVGLRLELRRMICGDFHAERSANTDALTCREESPFPEKPPTATAAAAAAVVAACRRARNSTCGRGGGAPQPMMPHPFAVDVRGPVELKGASSSLPQMLLGIDLPCQSVPSAS